MEKKIAVAVLFLKRLHINAVGERMLDWLVNRVEKFFSIQ